MPIALRYEVVPGSWNTLVIDGSVTETHSGDVTITESPVERGANLADHARQKPLRLKVEGLVCDYPLDLKNSFSEFASTVVPRAGRAAAVVSELRGLQAHATLLEVHTGVLVYSSMLLESLAETRDRTISSRPSGLTSGQGVARKVSLSLREIRVVDSEVVPLKRVQKSTSAAQVKVATGKKSAPAATEAERGKSILARGDDLLGGSVSGMPGPLQRAGVQ